MRTMTIDQWMELSPEEKAPMIAWFKANGAHWEDGMYILERRCGVTLLNGCFRPVGEGLSEMVIYGDVFAKRPHTVLSEAPFPWPDAP